jgi:predicted nucleic acid-binding protein
MRFVDANVFIYALVKSPKKDYDVAMAILRRIENGEETAITLPVVQEVIDWLEYNNRKKEIATFLIALNSYISMAKLSPSWDSFLPAIEETKKQGLSFVDSLTLGQMKMSQVNEIYSNDKDFDRIKGVKRIWE